DPLKWSATLVARGGRPPEGAAGFRRWIVPHYLFKARYTTAGIQGVLAEGGSKRHAAVEALVKSVGGKLEAEFWAFGDDDYIAIAEMPDNVAAATMASTVSASGAVGVSTTVLLTAADIDEVAKRKATYRPPGR
ncbi:MAG: GYD domain-containing protein, partial [Candidatus Limnocylindrales bacterium]